MPTASTTKSIRYQEIPLSDGEKIILPDTYSLSELVVMYKTTPPTFRKWLRAPQLERAMILAGYRPGQRLLYPAIVKVILEHLGQPLP